VFFGVEIVLRAFSADAIVAVMLSAVVADLIAQPFLGARPFLVGFPAGVSLRHPADYLLVAGLAVIAALIGQSFTRVLYATEDFCDKVWRDRPEWARPAVGGVVLGLVLLAVPQLYGTGYQVMYKATAGDYVVWFLLLLAAAKIFATSLSFGIGGSGGVFAPSLFIGVTAGMAYGDIMAHVFGAAAGPPALYGAVAMGAAFAAAARAPLTSFASVVEMTGDFSLTIPVLLAVAISATVARSVSYGSIYTTKLLRRGIDIDAATPWRVLRDLKVNDVMRQPGSVPPARAAAPQVLHAGESLPQVLRQLAAGGDDGLPVVSPGGRRVAGWVTRAAVLDALASFFGTDNAASPAVPLPGYELSEVTITGSAPEAGRKLGDVSWPPGVMPLSVLRGSALSPPDPELVLAAGDRVRLFAPAVAAASSPAPSRRQPD
jgi:chloride channel protein, CIC family